MDSNGSRPPPAAAAVQLRAFVPALVARNVEQLAASGSQPLALPFEGVVAVVDISGSVALAQALQDPALETARGDDHAHAHEAGPTALQLPAGARGADELSARMNAVFRRVLEVARSYHADALRFLGDAVLFMLEGEGAGGMAAAARAAVDMVADVLATEIDPVLKLHCAITAGTYFALKLGGHGGRFEVVVAGRSLADLEAGLSRAKAGQVSVSGAVLSLLGISARPAGSSASKEIPADGFWTGARADLVRVLVPVSGTPRAGQLQAAAAADRRSPATVPPASRSRADRERELELEAGCCAGPDFTAYIPPDVEAVVRSSAEFIKELRIITSLFLRFDSFACPLVGTFDPETLEDLSRRVSIAQASAARCGGVIRSFFRDDKGFVGLMTFGLFGSAHADDPLRAIKAAVRIRNAFEEEKLGTVSIGIATGRVFAGLVGDTLRCEYNVLGDAVNTAARLMTTQRGAIIVDGPTREGAAADKSRMFEAEALAPLDLKGKRGTVQAFRVTARRQRSAGLARHSVRGTRPNASVIALAQAVVGSFRDGELEALEPPEWGDDPSDWGDVEYEPTPEADREGGTDRESGASGSRSKSFSMRRRRSLFIDQADSQSRSGPSDSGSGQRRGSVSSNSMGAQLVARIRAAAGGPESSVQGRPAALDALSEFLAGAAWKPSGAGLLLVLGEAGSGKSEIARECRRLADFVEIPYLVASGDSLETSRPFQAFGDLLWHLVSLVDKEGTPRPANEINIVPNTEPETHSEHEAEPGARKFAAGDALGASVSRTVVKPLSSLLTSYGGGEVQEALSTAPSPQRRLSNAAEASSSSRDAAVSVSLLPTGMPAPAAFGASTAFTSRGASRRGSDRTTASALRKSSLASYRRASLPRALVPTSATRDAGLRASAARLIASVDPALATSRNCAILQETLMLSSPEGTPRDWRQEDSVATGEAALVFLGDLVAAILKSLKAVLIAEDLHCMDSLSLRLIRNLSALSGTSILATSRSLESTPDQLSALQHSPRTRSLTLSALSPEDAREVLAHQLKVDDPQLIPSWLARCLCDAAHGNAFAICEIVQYMLRHQLLKVRSSNGWTGEGSAVDVDPSIRSEAEKGRLGVVPDTLERLIVSRLDGLPASVANVAKRCSVLGARFPVPLAVYVLADDANEAAVVGALAQLEGAGILHRLDSTSTSAGSGAYGFAQSIVSEVCYRIIAEHDRQRLHGRAFDWLAQTIGGGALSGRAAIFAHHWLRSGRKLSGLPHVDMAAESAFRAGAYIEAASLCRRAMSVYDAERPSMPGALRAGQDMAAARRMVLLSECDLRMGRVASALEIGNRLLVLLGLPTADQAPILWGTASAIARVLRRGPKRAVSRTKFKDAGAGVLNASTRRSVLLEFLPVLFYVLQNDSDPLGALYYSAMHAELAVESPNLSHYVEGCTLMAAAASAVGLRKQTRRWLGAAEAALAGGGVSLRADEVFTIDRMMASILAGDFAEAERLADEAIAKFRLVGNAGGQIFTTLVGGHIFAMQGRAADAARSYASVVDLSKALEFGESQFAAMAYMSLAGSVLEFGGPPEQAREMLRHARAQFKDEAGFRSRKGIRLQYHALLATIHDRQGQVAEAEQEAENALDAIREHRRVRGIGRAVPPDGLTNHCIILLVRYYARRAGYGVQAAAPPAEARAARRAPASQQPAPLSNSGKSVGGGGIADLGWSVRAGWPWDALLVDIADPGSEVGQHSVGSHFDLLALASPASGSSSLHSHQFATPAPPPTATAGAGNREVDRPPAACAIHPAPADIAASAGPSKPQPTARGVDAEARPAEASPPASGRCPRATQRQAPLEALEKCVRVLETSSGGFPVVRPLLAWARAVAGAARAASASLRLVRRFRLARAARRLREAVAAAAALGLTTYEALIWHELSVLSADPRERADAAARLAAVRARMQPFELPAPFAAVAGS
eukprot:tig00000350_g24352.t1